MGLISAVIGILNEPSAGVSGVASEILPAVGISDVMGVLLAMTLVYLLGYLNILEAAGTERDTRVIIFGFAIPLFLTFGAIVIYHSLEALRLIGAP